MTTVALLSLTISMLLVAVCRGQFKVIKENVDQEERILQAKARSSQACSQRYDYCYDQFVRSHLERVGGFDYCNFLTYSNDCFFTTSNVESSDSHCTKEEYQLAKGAACMEPDEANTIKDLKQRFESLGPDCLNRIEDCKQDDAVEPLFLEDYCYIFKNNSKCMLSAQSSYAPCKGDFDYNSMKREACNDLASVGAKLNFLLIVLMAVSAIVCKRYR